MRINYALRAISLFLLALVASSCITTPGIKEPSVFICQIVNMNEMDCVYLDDETKNITIPLVEGFGFECVSPKDLAKIKTHHEILHKRLNKDANN